MCCIKLETQMRAGTHYLLDALVRVYGAKVLKLKDGQFEIVDRRIINAGLYETSETQYPGHDTETLIFHYHYFHTLPPDDRLVGAKQLFLIGYPFDSFFSDGLVFSSKKYSVAPSNKNSRCDNYRLLWNSPEWNFLESYMQQNRLWLNNLINRKHATIVRYEDFFQNLSEIKMKLEKSLGPFQDDFPVPQINRTRLYWTDDFNSKMDRKAFEALKHYFDQSLRFFYPEKLPFEYE